MLVRCAGIALVSRKGNRLLPIVENMRNATARPKPARRPWLPCRERLVKSPAGRGGRHRAGRADTRTPIFHLPAHVPDPMPEIGTALNILAVDNAREITCSSLRSRPQSRRHSQRMKFIGPVSGVHLRKRWIASQYVVFSGGRCAPTIRVRPADRSASSRDSAGSSGRRPVSGLRLRQSRDPAFPLRKDERS
jgi:hypothetical protein